MTDVQRQPIDSGHLWHWVDRLTRDRRQRLTRHTPGQERHVEYVPVPSLLTQLGEAIASDNTGGGTGKASPGSRSPIDLSIEDLFADMSTRIRAGLIALGGQPRILRAAPLAGTARKPPAPFDEQGQPIYDPEEYGRIVEAARRTDVVRDEILYRHDLAADLRQLPALIIGLRPPRQALVDEWADRYRHWVALAETILTADDEAIDLRGIRGHACPSCGESFVERTEPSTDPRAVDGVERYRDPALVIAFRDGQVQHITCRACDTGWWRGEEVDELSADIRASTSSSGRPAPARPDRPTGVRPPADVNHGGRLSGLDPDRWWPDTGGGSRRPPGLPRGMEAMTEADVGVCDLCGQELIRTDDDCWHPWTVERACPPEPPGTSLEWTTWIAAGNRPGRPGREHWRPLAERIPPM